MTSSQSVTMTTDITGTSPYTSNVTLNFDTNRTGPSIADMEKYTLFQVTQAINKYYLWVVFALGFPGNSMSLLTILRMPTVSSSKMHVALLAVVDNCAIISKLLIHQLTDNGIPLGDGGCKFLVFCGNFFAILASWILVAMTLERFIAVWFPLKVSRIYSKKKATIVLLAFCVFTFFFNLVYFWIMRQQHNGLVMVCGVYPEYNDFMKYYWPWAEALAFSIIPCLLVLISNMLIIINVQMSSKKQRHLTNNFDPSSRRMRDQQQITTMLIVISLTFLALMLPNSIFYIVKGHWKFEPFSSEHAKVVFTKQMIHVLSDLNHAVNFYLYFLSMATFRKRFLDTILCRRPAKKPKGATSSVFKTSHSYVSFHSTHSNLKCARGDVHHSHSLTNVSDVSSEV